MDFSEEELRKKGFDEKSIKAALKYMSLPPNRQISYIIDMFEEERKKVGYDGILNMMEHAISQELDEDLKIVKEGGDDALRTKIAPILNGIGCAPSSITFLLANKLYAHKVISFKEFQGFIVNILLPVMRSAEIKQM